MTQAINPKLTNKDMQYLQDLLPEYGFALHERGMYRANGRPSPARLTQDIQEFQTLIEGYYPQFRDSANREAQAHASRFRDEFYQQRDDTYREKIQSDARKVSAQATKEFSTGPLTPDQRQLVSMGKDIAQPSGKHHFDYDYWQDVAKKSGFKSMTKATETMDHLVDLADIGGERFDRAMKKHPELTPADVDVWGKGGAGMVVTLQERMARNDEDMDDYDLVSPSEQDTRKANVQDAWMDETASVPVNEGFDNTLMEDEGRTGDVARAWASNEDNDDAY